MNIENHLNTNNWFQYADFYDFVATHDQFENLVEVGVWKGHSISYLAKKIKNYGRSPNIYAVDLFSESPSFQRNSLARSELPFIYDIYNKNLENAGVREMIKDFQGWSWEVANQFEDKSLDFVFLDAAHDRQSVLKDIHAWLPKMKTGGLFSGHDGWNINVEEALKDADLIEDIKYFHKDKQVWYMFIDANFS